MHGECQEIPAEISAWTRYTDARMGNHPLKIKKNLRPNAMQDFGKIGDNFPTKIYFEC